MQNFNNYDYRHANDQAILVPPNKTLEQSQEQQEQQQKFPIKAHPFAVADPRLGNIDWNDDTRRIPMFTLEMQIEKSFTGYKQRVTWQQQHEQQHQQQHNHHEQEEDEGVIHALQHSLFCASLFETIQQEINFNSTTTNTTNHTNKSSASSIVWLSSEMEELYHPAPSHMAGGSSNNNNNKKENHKKSLCLVYAHQGEIKVQLDSEYSLILQLVEENPSQTKQKTKQPTNENNKNNDNDRNNSNTTTRKDANNNDSQACDDGSSGSQSPQQLHALCRVLLYNAQCLYHEYCREQQQKQIEHNDEKMANMNNTMYPTKSMAKPATVDCPNILSNCVDIGNKFILERKIRKTLQTIQSWILHQYSTHHSDASPLLWKPNNLSTTTTAKDMFQVEWLALPLLSVKSQFAMRLMDVMCMDVVFDG